MHVGWEAEMMTWYDKRCARQVWVNHWLARWGRNTEGLTNCRTCTWPDLLCSGLLDAKVNLKSSTQVTNSGAGFPPDLEGHDQGLQHIYRLGNLHLGSKELSQD